MSNVTPQELFAVFCFGAAIIHTFSVKWFQKMAHRYPRGSVTTNIYHLLGEIEVVFGIWAAVLLIFLLFLEGPQKAVGYLETRNFTEPAFVFVVMVICSARPILAVAMSTIDLLAKLLPLKKEIAFYMTCLIIGPLMGSFITEPAAMTVTACILLDRFYSQKKSEKFKYATLGLLFVNVSIGGTLTPYAAPPILMVASKWNWNLIFMIGHFGWKALLSILVSTAIVTFRFRQELTQIMWEKPIQAKKDKIPYWVTFAHILFLGLIVLSSHSISVFIGLFLFFLGLVTVTREHQNEIKLREGLMVAFFLGGLVTLGGYQGWWLEPLLTQLNALPLFLGSIALTAITDNAALTYLGSLVPSLSEGSKYALVAGAVTGGGLTVIANAPNPAGFGILNSSFGEDGISPVFLFTAALLPTTIAACIFWFF